VFSKSKDEQLVYSSFFKAFYEFKTDPYIFCADP